jgi:hypothetical protein
MVIDPDMLVPPAECPLPLPPTAPVRAGIPTWLWAFAGLACGAAVGAAVAWWAWKAVMRFALAGTARGIATLAGAAAKRAALAWLGGGTVAHGGRGIAGGVAAFALTVAGPALLAFGAVAFLAGRISLRGAVRALSEAKRHEGELFGYRASMLETGEAAFAATAAVAVAAGRLYAETARLEAIGETVIGRRWPLDGGKRADGDPVPAGGEKGISDQETAAGAPGPREAPALSLELAEILHGLLGAPLLGEGGRLPDGARGKALLALEAARKAGGGS